MAAVLKGKRTDVPQGKGTGTLRAYEEIRNQILDMVLDPGQSLDEAHFVKALGISRTPVREAFIRLAGDGLVDLLPNRGARVSMVDLSTVREFFEALDVNQRMVTRLAATRRTSDELKEIDKARLAFEDAAESGSVRAMVETNVVFHARIADACGNSFVARHYRHLLTLGHRLGRMALVYDGNEPGSRSSEHINRVIEEHRRMYASLVGGDADTAEQVAREHTETYSRRVRDYIGHSLAGEIAV